MTQWYYVISGNQVGPLDEDIIRTKISTGEVTSDTNVWKEGMSDWLPANQTQLSQYFSTAPTPPPLSMTEERKMEFKGTGLQALGWGLLVMVLSLLVIPTAWGAVGLYRWFVRNLSFSDGTKASFEGRGGEVWGYFIIAGILNLAPQIYRAIEDPVASLFVAIGLPILLLPITVAIWLQITRWFFSKIKLSCGTNLSFKGRYAPYLGWMLLLNLSGFTIIGMAWAAVAMLRWVCRNIDAGPNKLVFVGSGWGLLWRCFLAILASIFIIPLPWMAVWILRWYTRNMLIKHETA